MAALGVDGAEVLQCDPALALVHRHAEQAVVHRHRLVEPPVAHQRVPFGDERLGA
jgi:hypothetical protein